MENDDERVIWTGPGVDMVRAMLVELADRLAASEHEQNVKCKKEDKG